MGLITKGAKKMEKLLDFCNTDRQREYVQGR